MIKDANYVANQQTLIRVQTDCSNIRIKYSDIRPYWADARPSCFEGGRCFAKGDYLIFTFLTASGQGGVVCVWDCAKNKLAHISAGAYCVAATLADGKLYTLHDISHFCTPYHLRVFACPFGTMDANVEGAALFADQPTKIDNYSETVPSAKLRVAKGRIAVVIGDKEITFAADENSAYTMKDEFAAYYNNGDSNLDSDLLLKQGMLL